MNHFKKICFAEAVFATLMFVACGDSSTNSNDNNSVIKQDFSSSVVCSSSKIESSSSIGYGKFTDERDGQTYKTVTIGTQTWMVENLNYEYSEGTAKSYCYDNEPSNCDNYGRLYLWSAAMDSAAVFSTAGKGCGDYKNCDTALPSSTTVVRGVCPKGWHLPSKSEWETLFGAVGDAAGMKLKSSNGWYNDEGTDEFGFSALPAGVYLAFAGTFHNVGEYGYFWSSTEEPEDGRTYAVHLYHSYSDANMTGSERYHAWSVRCLQDSHNGSEASSSSSFFAASSSSIGYGKFTDERDGQTYKTVTIGSQTWMAENLNYEVIEYNEEDPAKSFCYKNHADSCSKYGRLYTWAAATEIFDYNDCGYGKTCKPAFRDVCPKGWHLPSKDEWDSLLATVGGYSKAGTMLKSTSGWRDNGNGLDTYGFSALPGGNRFGNGNFYNVGDNAYFWSSSEYDSYCAFDLYLGYNYEYANIHWYDKDYARSVRCVQD